MFSKIKNASLGGAWVLATLTTIWVCGPALAGDRANLQSGSDDGVWASLDRAALKAAEGERRIRPQKFKAFELDHAALGDVLIQAPMERTEEARAFQPEIRLPMPDGGFERFRFFEAPVMRPDLAAKFPQIKTYAGQGVDDPNASVRFDITPSGLHASVISSRGWILVAPYLQGDNIRHVSYDSRDNSSTAESWSTMGHHCRQSVPSLK